MAERTLIIIKPDAVQRYLAGEIIGRFEKKGFKLVAAKFMHINKVLASQLHAILRSKPFYDGLIKYTTSAPSIYHGLGSGGCHRYGTQNDRSYFRLRSPAGHYPW